MIMPEFEALNAYRIMWLFVFFDLPVTTKKQRHDATRFRKDLLDDGFTMMQFSVYIRHCSSYDSAKVHAKRVGTFIPILGQVSILAVTDKQYGDIVNILGHKEKPPPPQGMQLELL